MSPSKDRDACDADDRPRQRRHKSSSSSKSEHKDRDKDKNKYKDKDKERHGEARDEDSTSHRHHHHHHRHRSSRLKQPKPQAGSELGSGSHRRHGTHDDAHRNSLDATSPATPATTTGSSMASVVPELGRGISADRRPMPYPSFSKTHSKERLHHHSKEDVAAPTARRTHPLTPEPTDVGSEDVKRSKSVDAPKLAAKVSLRKTSSTNDRPPSPPETDLSAKKKRRGTPLPAEVSMEDEQPRSTWKEECKSKLSQGSSQATFIMSPASNSEGKARARVLSPDAFSTRPSQVPSTVRTASTSVPMSHERGSEVPTPSATPADRAGPSALPLPPPPPPPLEIQETPRVDYLLQNGGLPHAIPKTLLSALPRQNGYRPSVPPLRGAETLFAPFFHLLDQYQTVLSNNGSVAVATGHRTVARRLLDRLENVFSRDLSPDGCSCVMCERSGEPRRGLGWGEVLERVSGRVELAPWPPLDPASLGSKAVQDMAGMPVRPASPINMDPDIAEEFREHYLRQTKKVRSTVDKWMSSCNSVLAPLPQEIDDETLNFAILTTLHSEERPYFNAFLSGSRELQPTTRAPTPMRSKARNDFLVKTGLSLQRLYRLSAAPRDAESAVYLIRNPVTHDLIHTVSDINASEWEILTSGRFDGFLWSGADDDMWHNDGARSRRPTPAGGIPPVPSRGGVLSPATGRYTPGLGSGSRTTTPFSSFSRGATPASFVSGISSMAAGALAGAAYPSRAAVSHDEETELAVLAEVERDIFAGMEALEDAFETLHRRAELVRAALRKRGAGISMSLQRRRALGRGAQGGSGGGGGGGGGVDVLPLSGSSSGVLDRPAWAEGGTYGGDEGDSIVSESEWGGDDASEIAPDDSASNISSSKLRRPKRRRERATPAPIEEEEEA